ncbi:MAG TPA: hypothetical protein VFC63_24820 [Blastocatellia bacterium]|nr:hypothetical protein [Blastocatellia bacterium]
MSGVVNPQITDAVAETNNQNSSSLSDGARNSPVKLHHDPISEQTAMLSNLVYANLVANVNLSQQNAVANQQAMNELGVAILGKVVNLISNLGPLEARSATEILTGNTFAELIVDLKAALAAVQNQVSVQTHGGA